METQRERLLINLTGSPVMIIGSDPLPACATPPRIVTEPDHRDETVVHPNGERVVIKKILEPRRYVVGLPDSEHFTYLIVEQSVYAFCEDRTDLLTPSVTEGSFIGRRFF